ncbi:AraC family transcriptional regulator [Cerasicoccus fimbriatus]|uniref:AraC family transcriptional regulator n=1 Tax=Cerasicoccus fimbriatus TaxID=3014554 RepID=UPI0022B2EA4E|nr:AraC family transcriptional regulator [Cerasicoccus sp. TK19100]
MNAEKSIAAPIKALIKAIAHFTEKGNQEETAIDGLALYTSRTTTDPFTGVYEPSICIVAQGAKRLHLGEDSFVYDARHHLITSVQLPTVVRIIDASPKQPYYGLRLKFNLREVAQLMVDSDLPPPKAQQSKRAMAVGANTVELLDAVTRLIKLLNNPQDIPILAPTIQREIIYRLLTGELGGRLRQIASGGSQGHQMAKVIDWLSDHYTQPLKVEELAQKAGMSASTFHHHFRNITAMSPLQFQKQLRLREARRLMLMEKQDAATASFSVGYESPSQFSREYSRLFGAPPMRDIANLQQMAQAS